MSAYTSRPYQGRSDIERPIPFAQRLIAARMPGPSYYHPGNFAWELYNYDGQDDVRTWSDASGDVVACAIFEPPLTFQFALAPQISGESALVSELLAWVEARRAAEPPPASLPRAYEGLAPDALATWSFESDSERVALLEARGYTRGPQSGVRFRHTLDELPAAALPPGARFVRIDDGLAEARAELHRAAWSVWGPSQHTVARYRRLRVAPLYDPDLDVVLEYDGEMVSYCVCWLDAANKVGLFEPVGTRASATQRGFGRAVMHEGLRRLRERGMTRASVGTHIINAPAIALYLSAGFEIIDREHFYVKAANR